MQLSDFGVAFKTTTLKNGAPLFVFERPGMPVTLKVAFLRGSRFDSIGKEGLAHFAEHMTVSGTKKYPTKHDLGLYIESKGASFNASTSADKMDVYIEYADDQDSGEIVDLMEQFLQHSLYNNESIELERGAILAELAGKKSDPGVYIYRLWKSVAYQGNLLSRDTIGTEESLHSITRDDLLNYYQHALCRNNAVIVASGGTSLEKIEALLNNSTFLNANQADEPQISSARSRENPIAIKQYPGAEQCHVAFGFPIVAEDHPDYWPLFMLSRILGAGRTSRLFKRLRNELGLVYSASAGIDSWHLLGSLTSYTSCKKEHLPQVLDVITQIFRETTLNIIPEDELEHKKSFVAKISKLRMQTSTSWVNYHTDELLKFPHNPTTLVDDLAQINAVTAESILQVSQKYLQSNGWYLAICGDVEADNIRVNF